VVRCVSENENKKDTRVKENGPHAQNVLTILGLIDDVIEGDLHDHFMIMGIFIFIVDKILI
jgi:hypothetical protein